MKIKDFASIINGATPSSEHPEFYDGDIVWFTPKDLSDQATKYVSKGERTITKMGYDSCSTKMIPAGNVLMSSRAPIGLLAITTVDCCTNQGFKSFDVDRSKCNPEYLYYYLKYHIQEIETLGSGTTFKEVSKTALENYEISLPSLKQQSKCVDILSQIDEKINLNDYISSELESMAKLLYDYWFVQFDFPDEDGKPYKSSGGKMVWNEELKRDIPEGWEVKRLGDCCSFENGDRSANYPSGDDFIPVGIPFITGGAINEQSIDYDELRFISEEKYNSLRAGKANYGDILMTLRGSLAKYVLSPFDKLAIASALVIVRPRENITKEYLLSVLTSEYYTQLMNNYNNGSVQANLSVDVVRTFPIVVPREDIINQFDASITVNTNQRMNLESENRELASIRDFLLPMLMNGQVKISRV